MCEILNKAYINMYILAFLKERKIENNNFLVSNKNRMFMMDLHKILGTMITKAMQFPMKNPANQISSLWSHK